MGATCNYLHSETFDRIRKKISLSLVQDSLTHLTADKKPLNVLGVVTLPTAFVFDSFSDRVKTSNLKFRVASGLNFHCILGSEAHQLLCSDYLKLPGVHKIKFHPRFELGNAQRNFT